MTQDQLQRYLDERLTDLCNRYLNAVDDLGVINRGKRAKIMQDILKARNALLDHWVPIYAADLSRRLAQDGGGETSKGHPS